MRHVKFTMASNDEGFRGIVPNIFRNWSSYNPTEGFGLGHDLIEHGTKERGYLWQELMAFGAILYVRNWGDYVTWSSFWYKGEGDNITRQAKALASEMPDQFRNSLFEGLELELPEPPSYKLTKEEKDKLKYFMHTFRTETNKAFVSEDYTEDENYIDAETFEKIERLIGYGFAKAKKRYSQHDVYCVNYIKEVIEREVTKKWNFLMEYVDSGEEFTLSYDIANGHCEIRHNWLF